MDNQINSFPNSTINNNLENQCSINPQKKYPKKSCNNRKYKSSYGI